METRSNSHGYGHDGYYGPSSSSPPTSFDHLFGPKDSSSPSTTLFGSIFSPPSSVQGRDSTHHHQPVTIKKHNIAEEKLKSRSNMGKSYETERAVAEPCYLSSSIYYGGQENYSHHPVTCNISEKQQLKKHDDPSGSTSPDSASRGNWWQGSLYY